MKRALSILLSVLVLSPAFTLTSCNNVCKHDDPTKIVAVEAVAPTCQETGLTEGIRCTICETMVVPQIMVPVAECNNLKDLEPQEPTCVATGLTAGKQCNLCGTIVVEQTVLSKTDCKCYDWIIDKEVTDHEDGLAHGECVVCGETFYQEFNNKEGSKCLIYSLSLIDGSGTINISDFRGKTVILYFWGTWATPCKEMLSDLDEIAEQYADEVVVIAIHSVFDKNTAKDYIDTNYPETKMVFAYDESLTQFKDKYYTLLGGTSSYPRTLVLDENGVIVFTHDGRVSYSKLFEVLRKR